MEVNAIVALMRSH